MTRSRECCGNNEGKLSFTKHRWMSSSVNASLRRADSCRPAPRPPGRRTAWSTRRRPPPPPRGSGPSGRPSGQAGSAPRSRRWTQSQSTLKKVKYTECLSGCLQQKVVLPCVRVIDDLRLERRGYPLLLQVCPINAVEKRVCFDSSEIISY